VSFNVSEFSNLSAFLPSSTRRSAYARSCQLAVSRMKNGPGTSDATGPQITELNNELTIILRDLEQCMTDATKMLKYH
jgi:hypothetical protein